MRFGGCDSCGGEAAELGGGEAEIIDGLSVCCFVDWDASGDSRLTDEIGADEFEFVHREIAGFEGGDHKGSANGFVHFGDGGANGFGGEEFHDLERGQGELFFQCRDFAVVFEEEEEIAGVLA